MDIGILPSISKVIESLLYDRMNAFLSKNNTFHANQFGFQRKSETLSVSSFKYLGVTIQGNLKWNFHINLICAKLAGITGAAKRLGNSESHSIFIFFLYKHIIFIHVYLSTITIVLWLVLVLDKRQHLE